LAVRPALAVSCPPFTMPKARSKPIAAPATLSHWILPSNQIQEELSYAYAHAVAYYAGCKLERRQKDMGGVDATLVYYTTVYGFVREHYELRVQLKATYRAKLTKTSVKYRLDLPTYYKLSHQDPPILLVVFLMPPNPGAWLKSTSRLLSLHKCAYWFDVRHVSLKPKQKDVPIEIPLSQCFDTNAIQTALRTITLAGKQHVA
jgi:hypothetical protein